MTKLLYTAEYLAKVRALLAPIKKRSLELLEVVDGESIAEMGCGTGPDAEELASHGAKVWGIDSCPEFIEKARALRRPEISLDFKCCDVYQTDFEAGFFHKVRYDRVFQHLESPDKALAESYRVLRNRGLLQIVDTDYLSITLLLSDINLERALVDHIVTNRIPNANSIRRLPSALKHSGFTLIKTEVHPYVIGDYTTARNLLRFDIASEELQNTGRITQAQRNTITALDSERSGSFNMVINQVIIMAIKNR